VTFTDLLVSIKLKQKHKCMIVPISAVAPHHIGLFFTLIQNKDSLGIEIGFGIKSSSLSIWHHACSASLVRIESYQIIKSMYLEHNKCSGGNILYLKCKSPKRIKCQLLIYFFFLVFTHNEKNSCGLPSWGDEHNFIYSSEYY
jgi:hypothetical protein